MTNPDEVLRKEICRFLERAREKRSNGQIVITLHEGKIRGVELRECIRFKEDQCREAN